MDLRCTVRSRHRLWKSILIAISVYVAACALVGRLYRANDNGDNSASINLHVPNSIMDHPHEEAFYVSRRLWEKKKGVQNSLKLTLVHRNSMDSPLRKEFASIEEEIINHVETDGMRVEGLAASVQFAREPSPKITTAAYLKTSGNDEVMSPAHAIGASSASSPDVGFAPSPEPSFEGRLTSGAFLPTHVGEYFVEFAIGTPPQRFLFITDSGSDLVWAPCSMCKDCPANLNSSASAANAGAAFFPETSSTFQPISCSSQECELVPPPSGAACNETSPSNCTYAYTYSDRTRTTGVFAYETITMTSADGRGAARVKNVAFGCGLNNTGQSITQVGGVIGLGQGPISFPSQVGSQFGNKFSYCFTSFFLTNSSSLLVFGDDSSGRKLQGPLQYTPFVPNPFFDTFYYVGIEEVSVDRKAVPIDPAIWKIDLNGNGGSVIDSGTTLTFFFQPAYTAIIKAFRAAIAYPLAPPTAGLSLCYNVSGIVDPVLPILSIRFQGDAIFQPPAENYLLSPTDDLRCLGLVSSSGMTVLGNLIQQNYYVEYDRLHSRLGLARAQCAIL